MKHFIYYATLILFIISCNSSNENSDTDQLNSSAEKNTNQTIDLEQQNAISPHMSEIRDTNYVLLMRSIFGTEPGKDGSVELKKNQLPKNIVNSFKEETEISEETELFYAKIEYKTTLEDNRDVLVISINPEGNDCHACAPMVFASVMKKRKESKWSMSNLYSMGPMGIYGIAPSFGNKKISPVDIALVASTGDLHMGYNWSSDVYYSINSNFKKIFSIVTHEDNSGACNIDGDAPDFEACFEYEAEAMFLQNNTGYYDIEVHTEGTKLDKERNLTEVDEIEIFKYVDGIYVKE